MSAATFNGTVPTSDHISNFGNTTSSNDNFNTIQVQFLDFIGKKILFPLTAASSSSNREYRTSPSHVTNNYDLSQTAYGAGNFGTTNVYSHSSKDENKPKWDVVVLGSVFVMGAAYFVGTALGNLNNAKNDLQRVNDFESDFSQFSLTSD